MLPMSTSLSVALLPLACPQVNTGAADSHFSENKGLPPTYFPHLDTETQTDGPVSVLGFWIK